MGVGLGGFLLRWWIVLFLSVWYIGWAGCGGGCLPGHWHRTVNTTPAGVTDTCVYIRTFLKIICHQQLAEYNICSGLPHSEHIPPSCHLWAGWPVDTWCTGSCRWCPDMSGSYKSCCHHTSLHPWQCPCKILLLFCPVQLPFFCIQLVCSDNNPRHENRISYCYNYKLLHIIVNSYFVLVIRLIILIFNII